MRRHALQAAQAFLQARHVAAALPLQPRGDAVFSQPLWRFDANVGSDGADGIAAPLRTFAEYFRRTGFFRPVPVPVTLQFETDWPETDPILLSQIYGIGGTVTVLGGGASQVLHTGQLSAATNLVTNVGPSGQITLVTDLAIGSWTPYLNKQVVLTSGPNAGGGFIVYQDLGGGVAAVSVPNKPSSTAPFNNLQITLAGNETYQILERRLLGQVLIQDVGSLTFSTRAGVQPSLAFRLVKIPQGPANIGHAGFGLEKGQVAFYNSELSNYTPGLANVTANSCYITGALVVSTFFAQNYNLVRACSVILNGGVMLSDLDIFDSCPAIIWNQPSHFHVHHPIGVYNSTSFLTVDHDSSLVIRHGLFGSANHTSAVFVKPGSQVTVGSLDTGTAFAITGTGGGYSDILFGVSTAPISQLPAMDPATYTLTGLRSLSFANFLASVASGGFGQKIFDPACPSTTMAVSDV
jgi:hypothetical protein